MLLTGHEAEIYSCSFSPNGEHLASGSFERNILLWNVYGDCKNWNTLKGHTGAVLQVQWSRDSQQVYSASADMTVGVWDAQSGDRVRKCKGHTSFVTALARNRRGQELLVSGGDDGAVLVWDPREKNAVDRLATQYPVTAVEFDASGDCVFVGSIDNNITTYDLRKKQALYTLSGHTDTITGIKLNPDGTHLLSNGMDNTVRIWDVKPFAAASRLVKTLDGAPHDFSKNLVRPCWSRTGRYVACGAGDRTVVVWDTVSKNILYKLPGHRGTINDVDWHPTDNILVSCSTDKTMFLGEVDVAE
ncbi:hypothetical protein RI367_003079 [Sorochytrium milnesiophthora]